MDKEQREIITAIQNGNIYDYIANNYWQLSNNILKDILLEFIAEDDKEVIVENLKDMWRA